MSKKDSYWFKHDSTASRDLKMMQIKAIYGYEGIGLFWSIIEVLREQNEYKWQSDQLGILSRIIGAEEVKINNFIADSKRIGLLIQNENYIYSNRLLKDMEVWESKKGNPKKKKTKLKRIENEIKANLKDKIKEEYIREDKIKEEVCALPTDEFSEPIKKWLAYKKERKEGYKGKRSAEAFEEMLRKFAGNDPKKAEEIIKQSMANNWAGIFELKTAKHENTDKPVYIPPKPFVYK